MSFYPDWMHCKSLGIDKQLLGSVLFLLVHHVLTGSVEQNLNEVWGHIIREYDSQCSENRFGQMRQTMFTTKSAPKLQGKAGEIKDLGPVLVEVWRTHYNPNVEIHSKILIVLEGSAHCDNLLRSHPNEFALPASVHEDLVATAMIYLSTWYELSMHFKSLNLPLFGLTGKAHMFVHCCLMSRLVTHSL